MIAAPQTAVDKALADRDRQWRRYRAAKRQQYEDLFARDDDGANLRKFQATLNHFGIEDADRMVDYVHREARKWLAAAALDIRLIAVEMISERCMRIREKAGMAPLDDPLPGDDNDVWRLCREAIL